MGRIVGQLFDGGCLVVKLLQGNAPVIIIQEIMDGQDKWRDLSGDGITKGDEVFGIYSFDGLLDDGSFEQ